MIHKKEGIPLRVLIISSSIRGRKLIEGMLDDSEKFKLVYMLSKDCKAKIPINQADVILFLKTKDTSDPLINECIDRSLDIPTIIVSDFSERKDKISALNKGVQDYLVSGQFDDRLLRRSIHYSIDRKKAELEIKRSLEEKEVLLKEVHHRVKNNLQMISSLLHLQSLNSEGKALEALRDSQNRIKSMSLLHEILYRSKDFSNISSKQYFNDLISSILRIYSVKDVSVETDIDAIPLDINTGILSGLVVNELVINSLKHAFPGRKGKIFFQVKKTGGDAEIIVRDNGIGLPKNFDFKDPKSLGLRIVSSLTKQMEGSIRYSSDGGSVFVVKFPLKK